MNRMKNWYFFLLMRVQTRNWNTVSVKVTSNLRGCPQGKKFICMLTTASQSGGWIPETSRSFHYWQPAPRWRLLPWLANPGNPAMIPHVEKQAPVTLIRQWKERKGQGRGDSLQGVPMLRRNANAQKNANTSTNRYDAQRSKNTRNPGTCAYLANRWPCG